MHFVPKDLRTYDLCLEAVGGSGRNGSALDFIPRKLQDKNVLLKAVESKPDIIESIYYKLLDLEIILASGHRE